jgi:hypothetical protein
MFSTNFKLQQCLPKLLELANIPNDKNTLNNLKKKKKSKNSSKTTTTTTTFWKPPFDHLEVWVARLPPVIAGFLLFFFNRIYKDIFCLIEFCCCHFLLFVLSLVGLEMEGDIVAI